MIKQTHPLIDIEIAEHCHDGHRQVQALVAELLADVTHADCLNHYFVQRETNQGACRQDMIPWLVFQSICGSEMAEKAIPLATAWALYLAAAHLMDDAQDNGRLTSMNESMMTLGAGNLALAKLAIDEIGLREMLAAMAQVTMLGCHAQLTELSHNQAISRSEYFRLIAGKSAALIATGAWLGGRLATTDPTTLQQIKSFGLALGMAMQIGDDCQDLAEDVTRGVYTLPVIEGLDLIEHPAHSKLVTLLNAPNLSPEDVSNIVMILDEMGVKKTCQRLIQAYLVQAAAVFSAVPGLKIYFADDVLAAL